MIEKSVAEFREVMDSLCTHCGECCRRQAIFLTDVEAPVITRSLKEMGAISLARKHLRINSTVFNLWHRFVLSFDDHCPFHHNERCSIYSKRPLTCQLYPMNFIGFIDRPESNLRTACLEIVKPTEHHACSKSYDALIDVGKRVFENQPELADDVYQFVAASYVDEKGLGYLFGQPRKSGKDAVILPSSAPSSAEIAITILEHYRSQFEDQNEMPDEILDHSEAISDRGVANLTSSNALEESKLKTDERITQLKRFRPELWKYWHESGST